MVSIEKDYIPLVAYTDGSYDKKTKRCSYGVVLINKSLNNGEPFDKVYMAIDNPKYCNMRNVGGEILGAEYAIKYARDHGYKQLDLYHDYSGIKEWGTDKWKANNECTEAYKELCKSISDSLKINFHQIKGHSNDKYNDLADLLAKTALTLQSK